MGIVTRQSINSSVSFYFGMLIGAINTVIIYPNVFEDQPEHLGLIQILLAYAIVVATFTNLGVHKIFIKFFPAIKEKGQLYFLSLIVPLSGFVLASLLYFLFKEQIFVMLNADELLRANFFYIILLVFFIGFYDILTSISRSFLSAATPIFINEVFLKFYSMLVLILHWYDYFDFTTFLQIYLLGYFLKFIILFIIQILNDRIKFSFSLKGLRLKEMISYGLYVLVGGASMIIVSRLDMMMIGSMLEGGLEQIAYYSIAFFIGNAIQVPGRSIIAISDPLVAKAWAKKDLDEILIIYRKSSINQLIIGGVFFACVWINIDEIFSLLPMKFQAGKWVVLYIGFSQLFNMVTGVNGSIIANSRFYRFDLYSSVFLLFITPIANYILIPIHGIEGAAMATAISIFLFNFIRLVLIKVKMDMHPFSFTTLYTLVILFCIYFSLDFLLVNIIETSSVIYILINIFIKSILTCALSILAVIYFNLSDDIKKMVDDFRIRIFN